MLDPFRSSLPALYQHWPSAIADTVSLRSDWAIYCMDYGYIIDTALSQADEQQQSLFDPDQLNA